MSTFEKNDVVFNDMYNVCDKHEINKDVITEFQKAFNDNFEFLNSQMNKLNDIMFQKNGNFKTIGEKESNDFVENIAKSVEGFKNTGQLVMDTYQKVNTFLPTIKDKTILNLLNCLVTLVIKQFSFNCYAFISTEEILSLKIKNKLNN